MLRKHFSIIFAVIIFAALSVFARPIRAQAMDSASVALILKDSDNAHEVAHAAILTVECVLRAVSTGANAEACVVKFNEDMFGLSQEHRFLHPAVVDLLKEYANRRRS